jgi:hypothetical protein
MTVHSTRDVRESLEFHIGSAAGFRENLIPKDKPWDPKNEKYAKCLNAVLKHVESLPDDDPTFRMLAACDKLFDEYEGFKVPEDHWQGVIHCQTDDPTAWFEDWAKSLIDDEAEAVE